MKIALVEQNGRPRIRWIQAIALSCMLGLVTSAIAVAVYFLLTGIFSPLVALIGFFGPAITVGSGIVLALQRTATTEN